MPVPVLVSKSEPNRSELLRLYTAPFHWACALRWRAKMTTNIVIFCTILFISFCIPVPVQAGTAHGTSFIWASIELSLRCINAINGHNLIPLFPFAAAANFFRFYSRSKFTYRLIHIYYLHKWPLRNTATYILVQRQQCLVQLVKYSLFHRKSLILYFNFPDFWNLTSALYGYFMLWHRFYYQYIFANIFHNSHRG